jgi:hypothetical protein
MDWKKSSEHQHATTCTAQLVAGDDVPFSETEFVEIDESDAATHASWSDG